MDPASKKRGDAHAVFLLMGTPKVALKKFVKRLYVLLGQLCAISSKVGKKGDLSIIQTTPFYPGFGDRSILSNYENPMVSHQPMFLFMRVRGEELTV